MFSSPLTNRSPSFSEGNEPVGYRIYCEPDSKRLMRENTYSEIKLNMVKLVAIMKNKMKYGKFSSYIFS